MGFLDLFRKKKEKKPIEIENVPFEELGSWIKLKIQTLEKDKEIFTNSVKSRVDQLIGELGSGIDGLQGIDWEKIKTEERVKSIVRGNLENYVVHLQQLKLDLSALEEMERIKINNVFASFDRRAGKNYQKSTFLIGKELTVINESVRKMFVDLNKLQEENKTLLDCVKVIFSVRSMLGNLESAQSLILKVDGDIKKIHDKVEALKLRIIASNDQIEKIKGSEDFREWKIRNEHYIDIKRKRDSLIVELRRAINLKSLAKAWHENETEMKIVKRYRENFEKAFDEDGGKILKELIIPLDNKDLISKNLQEIFDFDREVKGTTPEKSLTFDLEEEIMRDQGEIDGLNAEEMRELKRIEKLGIEKGKIRDVVKNSLREIRVEVA